MGYAGVVSGPSGPQGGDPRRPRLVCALENVETPALGLTGCGKTPSKEVGFRVSGGEEVWGLSLDWI